MMNKDKDTRLWDFDMIAIAIMTGVYSTLVRTTNGKCIWRIDVARIPSQHTYASVISYECLGSFFYYYYSLNFILSFTLKIDIYKLRLLHSVCYGSSFPFSLFMYVYFYFWKSIEQKKISIPFVCVHEEKKIQGKREIERESFGKSSSTNQNSKVIQFELFPHKNLFIFIEKDVQTKCQRISRR